MALSSTRMEYRISLNNLDRGVERSETVIVALHPSETLEHLTLRVLGWCLFWEESLSSGCPTRAACIGRVRSICSFLRSRERVFTWHWLRLPSEPLQWHHSHRRQDYTYSSWLRGCPAQPDASRADGEGVVDG